MSRKPVPIVVLRKSLPHDWRSHAPNWRIIAMLAKIPQSDYLAEVRAFELHHIAAGTLSDDWAREWKAWCHKRLVTREPEIRLFG